MSATIDERGLSCPQPVLDTLAKLNEMKSGTLTVLVDTEASKENVSRAAQTQGWRVDNLVDEGGEYTLTLVKD